MKIVNLSAIVIAASVFAIAVEYVHGWSQLEPVADQAGTMVYEWTDGRLGWESTANSASALDGVAGAKDQAN